MKKWTGLTSVNEQQYSLGVVLRQKKIKWAKNWQNNKCSRHGLSLLISKIGGTCRNIQGPGGVVFRQTTLLCKYPNAQFTITRNGILISSTGTHYQYFSFMDPTSGNFPFGTVPKPVICHYWHCVWLILYHLWYWAMPFPVRSFIGPRIKAGLYGRGPISGTGLCQFRYGALPVPVRSFLKMNRRRGRLLGWIWRNRKIVILDLSI